MSLSNINLLLPQENYNTVFFFQTSKLHFFQNVRFRKKNCFTKWQEGISIWECYYNGYLLFWHNREYFSHSQKSSTLFFTCGSSLSLLCGYHPWCPISPGSKEMYHILSNGCSLLINYIQLTGPLFRAIQQLLFWAWSSAKMSKTESKDS